MEAVSGTTPQIVSILLLLLTAYWLNPSRLVDLQSPRPAPSSFRHAHVSSRRVEFVPEGKIHWCSGQSEVKELCNFQNLCYSHHHKKYFIFDGSVLENDTRTTVVDLTSQPNTKISLRIASVSPTFGEKKEHSYKVYYGGKFIMFYPFVPNNIMHTFHDDILPLHATLSKHDDLPDGEPSRTIILQRSSDEIQRDYLDLYQLFSKNSILSTADFSLELEDTLSCFEDVTVGLSKETVWYQYGFTVPEGPIPWTGLAPAHVENFTTFVKERLGIPGVCKQKGRFGVLLSREQTRLILNEGELSRGISEVLGMGVETLSMEHNTTKEIIETVACARYMIGVHGSMLIFSLFLPPPPEDNGSRPFLLELYPFALRPDGYTPYKTLSALSGLDVEYRAWRNMERSRTVTRALRESGLGHLTSEERERINGSEEVPPHLCCYDPAFRFRLNQDTLVDVRAVLDIIGNVSLAQNGGGGCG